MAKAFSYIRFSTPEQKLGDSERRQLASAEAWAKQHGHEFAKPMLDDGISAFRGRNRRKGHLSIFLRNVHNGLIPKGSIIIVEDLDRLSRQEPLEANEVVREIIKAGILIFVVRYNVLIDRKNISNLAIWLPVQTAISVAHDESAKKSMRMRATYVKRREEAEKTKRAMPGRPPYWLHFEKGKLVEDPEKVALVQRIFRMRADGASQLAIVKTMISEGRKPLAYAKKWYVSSIKRLLQNRGVLGEIAPHERLFHDDGSYERVPVGNVITGYYPAIVDPETFARVQRRWGVKSPTGNYKSIDIFTGLLTCGYCGGRMVINGTSRKADGTLWKYAACSRSVIGDACAVRAGWERDRLITSISDAWVDIVGFAASTGPGDEASVVAASIASCEARVEDLERALKDAPSAVGARAAMNLEADLRALREKAAEIKGRAAASASVADEDAFRASIERQSIDDLYRLNSFFRAAIDRIEMHNAGNNPVVRDLPDCRSFVIHLRDGRRLLYVEDRPIKGRYWRPPLIRRIALL